MPNYDTTKCKCDNPKLNECGNKPENCCLHCDCDIHDNKDCQRDKRVESEKKVNFNINLHYFNISEFDQPGKPGSGKENMDINLLMILDNMRHRSGIPYKITSAYRDKEYNKSIGGVENSAHCVGKAVDISAETSKQKYSIIEAALHFGIQRIGVGSNFIHIDIQEENEKPTKVIWTY